MTNITKAAQDALTEFDRYFTSANGVDVPERVTVSRDEWRALRAALQDKSGDVKGEREAFERYMTDNGKWPKDVQRYDKEPRGYVMTQTENAWAVWQAARGTPIPESQPTQRDVVFLMHGKNFAFKVGNQQFTLDYEPTDPDEFMFMQDMLTSAFSTFTHDVKTASDISKPAPVVPDGCAIVPVEPTDEMEAEAENHYESSGSPFPDWKAAYRAMIASSQQKGGSAG